VPSTSPTLQPSSAEVPTLAPVASTGPCNMESGISEDGAGDGEEASVFLGVCSSFDNSTQLGGDSSWSSLSNISVTDWTLLRAPISVDASFEFSCWDVCSVWAASGIECARGQRSIVNSGMMGTHGPLLPQVCTFDGSTHGLQDTSESGNGCFQRWERQICECGVPPPGWIKPTSVPVTAKPTKKPTLKPTRTPSRSPTAKPTLSPTRVPTSPPSLPPSKSPTAKPTLSPKPVAGG
jgi:hypothetical protein